MLINNKYTVPDECPPDCPFYDDIRNYGQNATCRCCPIFACRAPDDEHEPLCPPDYVREDWAQEWDEFFKSGMTKLPALKL